MAWNDGRDEFEFPDVDAGGDATAAGPAGHGGEPGLPGRRAHGVLVAVAAIALLAGWIAVGGIQEPAPSPSPSAPPVCVPVATNLVPELGLRAAGSALVLDAAAGYSHLPSVETPGKGWTVPSPAPGSLVPEVGSGADVELVTSGGACIRYVVAEYADATLDHVPSQAERRWLAASAVDPPSPAPRLGSLPDGDWVLRVSAYFETGISGVEGLVITEGYFRVRVGSGPLPSPTPELRPLVTPAVPCGPAPAGPDEVELTLSAPGSGGLLVGVEVGAEAPVVEVPVWAPAVLAVSGDACALGWDIRVLDAETHERVSGMGIDNSREDAAWISQNRLKLPQVIGTYDVIASLHFGPGIDVVREWRLVGGGFAIPEAFIVAEGGSRVRMVPGCGLNFTLANGYSAEQAPCAPGEGGWGWSAPAGVARGELARLRVPAWSRLEVQIPGWVITTWSGNCGDLGPNPSGIEFFRPANGCALGGYNVAGSASPPAPAQFLARPGEFVVEITVEARAGHSFGVRMYALVAGR